MSGCQPFSRIFQDLIRGTLKWCPFIHGKLININCYKSNPSVQSLLGHLEKYVTCAKFMDVRRYAADEMQNILADLKRPESLKYGEEFHDALSRFRAIIRFVEKDFKIKLERLSCLECQRLDEAIVAFQNYCFYSSVVMAVSALESRIHEMIRRKDQRIYSKHFRDATLGQLIQVFDDDQYKAPKFRKLKILMPRKHHPLVVLLNQYRVFSAHPKEDTVTPQIAESVLHLCFTFLTDPNTAVYTKNQLKCKVVKVKAIAPFSKEVKAHGAAKFLGGRHQPPDRFK